MRRKVNDGLTRKLECYFITFLNSTLARVCADYTCNCFFFCGRLLLPKQYENVIFLHIYLDGNQSEMRGIKSDFQLKIDCFFSSLISNNPPECFDVVVHRMYLPQIFKLASVIFIVHPFFRFEKYEIDPEMRQEHRNSREAFWERWKWNLQFQPQKNKYNNQNASNQNTRIYVSFVAATRTEIMLVFSNTCCNMIIINWQNVFQFDARIRLSETISISA